LYENLTKLVERLFLTVCVGSFVNARLVFLILSSFIVILLSCKVTTLGSTDCWGFSALKVIFTVGFAFYGLAPFEPLNDILGTEWDELLKTTLGAEVFRLVFWGWPAKLKLTLLFTLLWTVLVFLINFCEVKEITSFSDVLCPDLMNDAIDFIWFGTALILEICAYIKLIA